VITIFLGCYFSQGQGGTSTMNPEIRYISEHAGNAFPTVLTIAPGGLATLIVRTNRDTPGSGVVGIFRRQFKELEITWLATALRSQEFANIKGPSPLVPGTATRQLRIKEDSGEEIARSASFSSPPAPSFTRIEEKVLDLVRLVRQHPLRAMVVEVSSLPTKQGRGEPLECRITLRNPGPEPLQLPPPDHWSQKGVSVQIRGIRSDVPLASRTMDHQRLENLSRDNMVAEQSTGMAKPLIPLSGGEGLDLVFRVKPDWPPGEYELTVEITFQMALKEGENMLPYLFVQKAGRVQIIGESKPGDYPDENIKNDEGGTK
jgi:hypothetical protein